MPTRRVRQSPSQRPKRSTAKKSVKAVLPKLQRPTLAKSPSAGAIKNGVRMTPAHFYRATRKLLSRHAQELQRVITEGHQLAMQEDSRLVRDLEMLQAAAKKIVGSVLDMDMQEAKVLKSLRIRSIASRSETPPMTATT